MNPDATEIEVPTEPTEPAPVAWPDVEAWPADPCVVWDRAQEVADG